MSLRRQGLTHSFCRSTSRTPCSTYGSKTCSQQKSLSPIEKSSSSSMSSAGDVDVHAAWDNYDMMGLPVERRRSDDRCSLLTQWTESSASLKSCRSHNAASSRPDRRTSIQSTSTTADSDDGAYWRRTGTNRTELKHRDRHKRDTLSSSKRLADSNTFSCLNKNQSRKYKFSRSAIQQNIERRGRVASRPPSFGRDGGRRHSPRSTSAAPRRLANADYARRSSLTANKDGDDYIMTSSEDEEHPPMSVSPNFVTHRASLLSDTTTSSSAGFAAPSFSRTHDRSLWHPGRPRPKLYSHESHPSSPRKRASCSSSSSLTTSNDMNNDDNDVDSSRSSEEVAVFIRRPIESVARQCREDDLRTVRSLFEFRSSDELRIANDFIDGVWNLCSRRSLYNERYICPKPITLASAPSLFQLRYSLSEKNLRFYESSEDGEIVANHAQKSSFEYVTQNEERSLKPKENNKDVVAIGNCSRRELNVADIVVHCDSVHKPQDRNCSRSELRPLEIISKLNDVTATISNEDELTICIRKSPKTFTNVPDDAQARNIDVSGENCCVSLPMLVKSACSKQLEHAAVSDAPSMQKNEQVIFGDKSSGLTTLLSDWLANRTGVRKWTEADNRNSEFPNELIQVFEALLVRSGVGEATSVANDIKLFQPLAEAATDFSANEVIGSSKLLQADIDNLAITLVKPADNDFGSLSIKSDKRAGANKSRDKKKKEQECEILWRLTPRLSVKPDLASNLASIELTNPMSCDSKEANFELFSPNQLCSYDNDCKTAMNIVQTNDCNDDSRSTRETRKRISRKARGRGKVKELIKLFESVSTSTLANSASPLDVKRATISAAVSVGKLLRRASEQEVTSCTQHACWLPDTSAKQPTVASAAKSTEALSSHDVTQAPLSRKDECLSKPEAAIVVHRSTVKWPTSRVRRKRFQRRVDSTTFASDRAVSRIDSNRLLTTHNSTLDTRTVPTNNDSENAPRVDNVIRETSEAASLSGKEGMKLINDNSSERHDEPIINLANSPLLIGQREASGCKVANVASSSNQLSPAVDSGRQTDVDLESSLLSPSRPENICQLPSASSSFPSPASPQLPSKSPNACEVADTANTVTLLAGGNGDIGGHHQEGGPTISNVTEESTVYLHGDVMPSTKYLHTVRIKPVLQSLGSPCQLPLASTVLSKSEVETTSKSTETSPREISTYNDCQRVDVRSWFTAGGPGLIEVPRWPLTSAKDVVSKIKRSKSKERSPAKATLEIETSSPVAYPVVRMPGVTVQMVLKDEASDRHSGEGNKTDGVEYIADSRSRKKPKSRTQSSISQDVPATKHKRRCTVAKLAEDDEKEFSEKSTLRRPGNKTVCNAAISKTTGFEQELGETASPGAASKTSTAQESNDPLERDCPNRQTTFDVTCSSCLCHVESHHPTDDEPSPPSQRLSPGIQVESTPLNRMSPITAKCEPASGKSTQYPGSVTVVYSRRRKKSARTSAVNAATPSEVSSQRTQSRTTDNYQRLAQQFLMTSLLEYRLDVRRK